MIPTTSRPGRFRPILTMVLVTIVLVLAWLGLEVYFALTAKPNPTIDYGQRAEELVASVQYELPGEDVWPVLMEATQVFGDTLVGLKDDATEIEWGKGNYSFDAYYEYEENRKELESQETASGEKFFQQEHFDQLEAHKRMSEQALSVWDEKGLTRRLDEVAASGKAVRPMQDSTQQIMIEFLLPELGTFRNMARALRARMVLARSENDWPLYTRSLEHGLAIGRIEMAQATLIDRLVGIAIRALMIAQLQEDLIARRLPAEALEGVQAAMDRQSNVAPMTHAFEAELLMELDAVQWTHDRRGRIILSRIRQLGFMGGEGPPIMNIASIVYPRKQATEEWFTDNKNKLIDYVGLSFVERRAAWQNNRSIWPDPVISWKMPLQSVLLPALGKAVLSDDQLKLHELGVRVMIAIERYRFANGTLPESLDVLTPQWLNHPPIDPYSSESQLLVYRRLETSESSSCGYILYSVGYDDEDNNGTAPTKAMPEALNQTASGTDFIFTETLP